MRHFRKVPEGSGFLVQWDKANSPNSEPKISRRPDIQQGLAPVSIGLLLAGGFSMAKGAISGVETGALAVAVLLILLQYKVNPALLVLASAGVGLLIPA
jgi:chromate transport protein ChrA